MPNQTPEATATQTTATASLQNLRKRQNPLFGCGAGIVAMIVGMALWFVIAQKLRMPVMSVIIAFGIASAIRYAGKTIDAWYGIVGGVLSAIAAITGYIASGIFIYHTKYPTISPKAIIKNLNFENAITLIEPVGLPIATICLLASIFVGFWFAFQHQSNKMNEIM